MVLYGTLYYFHPAASSAAARILRRRGEGRPFAVLCSISFYFLFIFFRFPRFHQ